MQFIFYKWTIKSPEPKSGAQCVKKVEVQEALPPAGVLGAEPLILVPQHFFPRASEALFAGDGSRSGLFDSLKPRTEVRG